MAQYDIMKKDKLVARIDCETGDVTEIDAVFLPFSLQFQNPDSIASRLNNILHFQEWCAERILMMSQKHAKLICNALALSQENSVKNKAAIALSYHCGTLQDDYWVKETGTKYTYPDISLFRNTSRNLLTPVSLKGKAESLFTRKLKNWSDLGTDGTLAKSWVRENGEYYLYKASDTAENEVLASTVLKALGIPCVEYETIQEDDLQMTKCKCFTNENISFVTYHTLLQSQGESAKRFLRSKFLQDYANMAVATYLLGNEDLHDRNWGVCIDNKTNQIIGLAPLYDFDSCFYTYRTSKNLYYLPECEFIAEDGTKYSGIDFDIDREYDIVGPTIEEAAYQYAPYSSIDFSNFNMELIPVVYREEFQKRMQAIQERQQEKPIPIEEYDR